MRMVAGMAALIAVSASTSSDATMRAARHIYTDPAAFCAAVRSTPDVVFAKKEPRYRGSDHPAWMLHALGVSPEALWGTPVYWRCRGGRVLGCVAGMSGLNAQVCFRDVLSPGWDRELWKDITPRR